MIPLHGYQVPAALMSVPVSLSIEKFSSIQGKATDRSIVDSYNARVRKALHLLDTCWLFLATTGIEFLVKAKAPSFQR